jgi:acyl-coenzyme A thioesterase PaaI-like protein
MKKSTWLKLLSFWPPFFGAGIRIRQLSPDFRVVTVELGLSFWNRNYVGTQFGGSLYSMCDPFYMLMLIENLGKGYIVWDKAATIRYKRPGKGKVRAEFQLSEDELQSIRTEVDIHGKIEKTFTIHVKSMDGEIIAEVDKLISIRRKASPEKP